jgi:hypothetical protein
VVKKRALGVGAGGLDMATEFDAHVLVVSLRCIECGRRWVDRRERWRVYLTDENPPDAVTYCPECARREFEQ